MTGGKDQKKFSFSFSVNESSTFLNPYFRAQFPVTVNPLYV